MFLQFFLAFYDKNQISKAERLKVMKYVLSFLGIVAVFCAVFFCTKKGAEVNDDFVRIHITANSDSEIDKNIKYKVKDAVVDFLIPALSDAKNKEDAEKVISLNLAKIQEVANQTLKQNGVRYLASVSVIEEQIPTRVYDDFVLESGIYQSLKIDLGKAKGDNWWCIVFPAVCFTSSKNPQNIEYISKIWDTIQNVTSR